MTKSRDVVFFEGVKEVKGVHNNIPPSKQIKHVVDEAVNDDELVKVDNCISFKEKLVEDVEGDEYTSKISFEEEF